MDILQYRTGPEAPWVGIPALKGDPGISVKSISINNNNHIVITLDDDSTIVSTNAIPIQGNGINILIVEELPTTGVEKTIYMVLRTEAYLNDYYDEYMWINNKWEIIGSTRLDLSNYYTKSEVNDAITNAVTAASSNYTAGSGINIDSNGVISANVAAADIEYDNTNSHMQATDIQSAIDYLATNSGSGGSDLPTDPAADGSYKLINTVGTNGGLSWEVDTAVPTKTSDLTNDSGFITSVPLATANAVGAVKPDGTTITIDNNGTISAQGDSSLPTDPTVDGSYKLVSTVETVGGVQTATWSWEEDSGGGTTYTFTNGLTESDGTVSWDLNNRVKSGAGDDSLIIGYSGSASGTRSVCLGGVNGGASGQYSVSIGGAKVADKQYAIGIGSKANANSTRQVVIGASDVNTDANGIFGLVFGTATSSSNYGTTTTVDGNGHHYIKGNLYVGCTDYTTTSSGPTTANCGGQKVFYGNLSSTDSAPNVDGAINWVYV